MQLIFFKLTIVPMLRGNLIHRKNLCCTYLYDLKEKMLTFEFSNRTN